ncbi:MAG: flagellar motor switch protein FliN [Rhodanobacteraceae bacterium]
MDAAHVDPAAMPEPPDAALATQPGEPDAGDAPKRVADAFQPLESASAQGPVRDLEMIMDIPVKLSVELGRTRLTIKQLLELAQGSVVELDGLPGEPMDILINGYLIARGEVVVVEDRFGIRITEIVTPSERLHRLNS